MGNATPLNRLKAWLSTWRLIQFVRDIPLYFDRRETYSQFGEDSFLVEHVFSGKNTGFYVDIGASHPIRISNTYALYRRGWSGIVVEPIHNLVRVHKRWRPRDVQVECLLGDTDGSATFHRMYPSTRSTTSREECEQSLKWQGAVLISSRTIPQLTLKTLFEKYVGSRNVDFMSVDIEGMDQFMAPQIRLLPREAVPQCLCIECYAEEAEQNIIKSLGDIYKNRKKIGINLVFWEVA
jgi:FkbM family methyltransferase